MIRIYLNEIAHAQLLGSKDIRYIRKWCAEHKIDVYTETNKSYVNHAEFELAYNRQFTADLRRNFPDNWEERYTYYNHGDISTLMKLKEDFYKVPMKVIYGGKHESKCDAENDVIRNFLLNE